MPKGQHASQAALVVVLARVPILQGGPIALVFAQTPLLLVLVILLGPLYLTWRA